MQHQINTTQNQQVDRFTFTNTQSSDLRIVFLPQILKHNRKIPQLDYQGLEGQFTFRGNEIKQEHCNLGLLVSITLKTNTDAGGLDFALVLPSINFTGQRRQDFETVAIAATRNQKIVANLSKTEFTYKVLTLKGCAEKLSIVAPEPSVDRQNYYRLPSTEGQEDRYNLMDLQRF